MSENEQNLLSLIGIAVGCLLLDPNENMSNDQRLLVANKIFDAVDISDKERLLQLQEQLLKSPR